MSYLGYTKPIIAMCRIEDMENAIRIDECSITLKPTNNSHESFAIKGGITVPKKQKLQIRSLAKNRLRIHGATTNGHGPASNEVINVPLSNVYRCTKSVTGNDHECQYDGDTNFVKKDGTQITPKTEIKKFIEIVFFSLFPISLCLLFVCRKRLWTWLQTKYPHWVSYGTMGFCQKRSVNDVLKNGKPQRRDISDKARFWNIRNFDSQGYYGSFVCVHTIKSICSWKLSTQNLTLGDPGQIVQIDESVISRAMHNKDRTSPEILRP
ncbi:hypothetical protein RF11_10394 [Thelohanellus kitauei]|uniref:Uncharacterized protein n=1 Tax=Thelohanellus kitauei TaxID=669202 RepID=A0A0C2JR93_THEKT|nr:hypothetical protein RF11_10394 [Thelohanellus kitauei]